MCPVPPCHGTGPRAALSPGRCLAPKLALFPPRHGSPTDPLLTSPSGSLSVPPSWIRSERNSCSSPASPVPYSHVSVPISVTGQKKKGELPSGGETPGKPREGRENSRSGGSRGWASSGAGAATSRHGSGSAPARSRPGDGMGMGMGTGTGGRGWGPGTHRRSLPRDPPPPPRPSGPHRGGAGRERCREGGARTPARPRPPPGTAEPSRALPTPSVSHECPRCWQPLTRLRPPNQLTLPRRSFCGACRPFSFWKDAWVGGLDGWMDGQALWTCLPT